MRLYVIVPLIVPDGPSTPSGTSHSKVHVPGKYSSKLKSGCSSFGRVGRPRSGIWLFGSCGTPTETRSAKIAAFIAGNVARAANEQQGQEGRRAGRQKGRNSRQKG